MKTTNKIYIRRVDSDKLLPPVHSIPVTYWSDQLDNADYRRALDHRIDKIVGGLLVNLNADEFFIDDSEFDFLEDED